MWSFLSYITYFCRSFKCLVPASDNLAFPTLSIMLLSDDNLEDKPNM